MPQVSLDASASTSGSGELTYLFAAAPGGLVPAILQTSTSPHATVQFVTGPGLYKLMLTVKDASGKTSTAPISLTYTPM